MIWRTINTLLMSMKAMANGHLPFFALRIMLVSTKAASRVLRPFLNPNCSSPRKLFSSQIFVILSHIRVVRSLKIFEGIVIGRYWRNSIVSPPYLEFYVYFYYIDLITFDNSTHFPILSTCGTFPLSRTLLRNSNR